MNDQELSLFWFRRDLRLEDNHGLFKALSSGRPVLPVFIFDRHILSLLPEDDARVSFLHSLLHQLDEELKKRGSGLLIRHGDPLEVIQDLCRQYSIAEVFTNHDYEPYALDRDRKVGEYLDSLGTGFSTFKDQVIFEKLEVVKKDGLPYTVYTPYMRQWFKRLEENPIQEFASGSTGSFVQHSGFEFPRLEDLGFKTSSIAIPPADVSDEIIRDYAEKRDFPLLDATSHIGPYLRFGTISIRKLALRVMEFEHTYLKELIWREFFMQILYNFPHVASGGFRKPYDGIPWRNNEKEFERWCQGRTGYPMVDAGMRELNSTGYMHNRVRMITASFLCKHLLIDWRWGEAYFAEKLLDFELASNNGNWQWAAGSGTDAAPYFRVFNPSEQLKKYDPKLVYVKRWVDEINTPDYPLPVVEHKSARQRALDTYKEALAQT